MLTINLGVGVELLLVSDTHVALCIDSQISFYFDCLFPDTVLKNSFIVLLPRETWHQLFFEFLNQGPLSFYVYPALCSIISRNNEEMFTTMHYVLQTHGWQHVEDNAPHSENLCCWLNHAPPRHIWYPVRHLAYYVIVTIDSESLFISCRCVPWFLIYVHYASYQTNKIMLTKYDSIFMNIPCCYIYIYIWLYSSYIWLYCMVYDSHDYESGFIICLYVIPLQPVFKDET